MTLDAMLRRHDAGDYYIHHWTGFCKPAVSARQAARNITERMNETLIRLAKTDAVSDGFVVMVHGAKRFVEDLWHLPPGEFEKLQNLHDEDLMNRVPYTPADAWLAREGRNLRFENR